MNTETLLASVPFSTFTVITTLPAPSLTEGMFVVWLKPIVTPEIRVNDSRCKKLIDILFHDQNLLSSSLM